MKKLLCLILSMILMLSTFAACGNNANTEVTAQPTTEATIPTQSPEEEEIFKVLMIGQSHAQDAS